MATSLNLLDKEINPVAAGRLGSNLDMLDIVIENQLPGGETLPMNIRVACVQAANQIKEQLIADLLLTNK